MILDNTDIYYSYINLDILGYLLLFVYIVYIICLFDSYCRM